MKKYCEKHDAYYDDEKDVWLEKKCKSNCWFCVGRPKRPSEVKSLNIRDANKEVK